MSQVKRCPPFFSKKDPKCEICKLIVNEVDWYIKRNASSKSINSTVAKVCNKLPSVFKILVCITIVSSILMNHLICGGPFSWVVGFLHFSWECNFMHVSVFSFSSKDNSSKMCFCRGVKLGERYPRILQKYHEN